MASQTVKPRFTLQVYTCPQAMGTCLVGLMDRTYSCSPTGSAGLSAVRIDTGTMAKSALDIGCLYWNGACSSAYTTGGQGRHYTEGVSSCPPAKGTENRRSLCCNCLCFSHYWAPL